MVRIKKSPRLLLVQAALRHNLYAENPFSVKLLKRKIERLCWEKLRHIIASKAGACRL